MCTLYYEVDIPEAVWRAIFYEIICVFLITSFIKQQLPYFF